MGPVSSWCAALVTVIGYYSILTTSAFELHWMLAYLLILSVLWWEMGHGWASPLGLFLVFAIMRFALPGLGLLFSEIPVHGLFETLGLTEQDWWTAHSLALLGVTSTVWGWVATRRLSTGWLFRVVDRLGSGVSPWRLVLSGAAIAGMGFVALIAFVNFNTSGAATETVVAGTFRNEQIAEGTGIFFHLALGLIAGSVLQVFALRSLGFPRPLALLPAVAGGVVFFVLGGRARALTPILAAFIGLAAGNRLPRKRYGTLAWYAGFAGVLLIVGAVGQGYRGDYGLTAFWLVGEFLVDYIEYAIWLDVGHLHSLAAVVKLDPGTLGVAAIWVPVLPGISKFLGLGRSGGVFIVESLTGVSTRKWGLHATLIADSYLSVGVIGVVPVCFVFGAWLRALHTWMAASGGRPPLTAALYGVALVYSLRSFFESVDKVSEMVIATAFVLLAGAVARAVVPWHAMEERRA